MNKDKLYPMRAGHYRSGLEDLVKYINKFSNTKEMVMIEIGSYAGESTEIFAKNFKKVISVDPYINDYDKNDPACEYMDLTEVYKTFNSVITNYDNILHIRKTSDDAIEDVKNIEVDLIYIDGSHYVDDVLNDALQGFKHLKVGGIMIFDDYFWNYYQNINLNPANAINSFIKLKKDFLRVHMVYSQVVISRISIENRSVS